jgi:endonuclease/exonuclease/phosphatase family metal-dependent hydrolase
MKRNVVGIAKAAILGALVAGAVIFALMRCGSGKEEIKQIASPVTVLTYNTHLFGGSNAEHARKLKKGNEIVFDDDNRAELIARKLETCGADIVALQELWACGRPKWFAERLQKVYPHSYYHTEQCPEVTLEKLTLEVAAACVGGGVKKLPAFLKGLKEGKAAVVSAAEKAAVDVIKKKYKLMNGLLLLSKYQIDTPRFHEFLADRTKVLEDALARKGVITATIVLPNGLPFRVGVTHANTDVGGWESQPDIADLAKWTTIGALKIGPAIMMGDFNVGDIDDDGAKYNKMANIFTGVGALDADRQVNKRNGITVNWAANQLLQFFFPDLTETRKCIDYVFYRPDGPGLTIKPESAKVITDWKYSGQMKGKTIEIDLSDHYPVVATFSLWNGPKPTTR